MWWLASRGEKNRTFILGIGLELLGNLLWFAVLVNFGLKARYWPLSTPEEFLLITLEFAAFTHLMAEIMAERKGTGWMAPFAIALLALRGRGTLTAEIFPPPPAFSSIWFQLHTLTASVAYGAFLVAGATSLGAIFRPNQRPQGLVGEMALGYVGLTLSMLIGALWSHFTWGNYWSWGLKEIWTLTLWLMAVLYFHIRSLPWWEGQRTWILVTLIMVVMLFSLLGMDWLARKLTLETLYIF